MPCWAMPCSWMDGSHKAGWFELWRACKGPHPAAGSSSIPSPAARTWDWRPSALRVPGSDSPPPAGRQTGVPLGPRRRPQLPPPRPRPPPPPPRRLGRWAAARAAFRRRLSQPAHGCTSRRANTAAPGPRWGPRLRVGQQGVVGRVSGRIARAATALALAAAGKHLCKRTHQWPMRLLEELFIELIVRSALVQAGCPCRT